MKNKHMNMHDPEDRKKHKVDYRRSFGLEGGHDESRSTGGKKIEHKKKHIEVKQNPNAVKARRTRNCSPELQIMPRPWT